ncbi:MAG: hypothetical protein KF857_05095 [Fimbriimonadaceae bacterium]|nr:hypothetical protein [Fimbriimonadaceae bacterium]
MLTALVATAVGQALPAADLRELHSLAQTVLNESLVRAGSSIPGGPTNTTGHDLRVPGGTQSYYPAFWVRDAAMMLGADFVSAKEVEGWIKVVVAAGTGSKSLQFPNGMVVPPYSVPDHITLKGEACWYPGAYTDQGVGAFGKLPPADDAFYFVAMVAEQRRLAGNDKFLLSSVRCGDESMSVLSWAEAAFDSVKVDRPTGLVVCDPVLTRVDWGFCDSVRKTGLCLFPSLLRWQAARELARTGSHRSHDFAAVTKKISSSIRKTFLVPLKPDEAKLVSATGTGAQDDIWGSAYALWLGVLPRADANKVARHLLRLYRAGKITAAGQVRHLPAGDYWESATSAKGTYQNGGYWATPTGWLVRALATVDKAASRQLLSEYMAHLRAMKAKGAPFEWCDPATGKYVNARYASSAGLVYVALTTPEPRPH